MNPKNIFTPLSMSEFLLTTETVPAYVASLNGVLPEASTAVEISGGNLNYAFRVSDAKGASVFLKQTPGFVKVLGSEAKLSNERMITERRAYVEWAMAIGSGPATACLPRLHHFDSERMVLVMEHLGSCKLLHERLMGGSADGGVALALGSFLGAAHASTHVTLVSPERAAELMSAFANEELRGLQLECVFPNGSLTCSLNSSLNGSLNCSRMATDGAWVPLSAYECLPRQVRLLQVLPRGGARGDAARGRILHGCR